MYLHLSSHTTSNYRTYTVVACSLEGVMLKGAFISTSTQSLYILATRRRSLTTIYDGNQLLSRNALIFNFSN